MTKSKYISFFFISYLLVEVFFSIKNVYAIPIFARKYDVSCMQCHIAIFRRNEFGDAFRRNGYQWIEGKDTNASVDIPIPLQGNAIGVGAIPASFPISVFGQQRITYNSVSSKKDKTEFSPHELELLSAGTLGKDISFGASWIIWEHGVSGDDRLEDLWLMFDNFYGRVLNLKIGKMPQTTSLFKDNDRLTLNHIITNTYTVKDFQMGSSRAGVEVNGIIKERIDYAIGVGDNNNNWDDENYKDFYYHIGWKPFGMTFTGVDPEVDLDNPSVSDFLIVNLVHYGYFGTESDFTASGAVDFTNRIKRFGFDLELSYRDITFQNGFVFGEDDNPANDKRKVSSHAFFSEIEYRIVSWLTFVYRYEHADNKLSSGFAENNHIPSLIYLFRENIKFSLEGKLHKTAESDHTITLNILYAF